MIEQAAVGNPHTEAALGRMQKAVAHHEHSNHQLGIDRGVPGVAVVRNQMLAQIAKIKNRLMPMISRTDGHPSYYLRM